MHIFNLADQIRQSRTGWTMSFFRLRSFPEIRIPKKTSKIDFGNVLENVLFLPRFLNLMYFKQRCLNPVYHRVTYFWHCPISKSLKFWCDGIKYIPLITLHLCESYPICKVLRATFCTVIDLRRQATDKDIES